MSSSGSPRWDKWEEIARRVALWITAIFVACIAGFGILYAEWNLIATGEYMSLIKHHYAFMIEIPSSAAAAVFVVLLMKYVAGNVQMKIPGICFKGAAGTIVFWIMCFWAFILAIKVLW